MNETNEHHPATFFSYDPEDGIRFHDTEDEARARAEKAKEEIEFDAADSDWHWHDRADEVSWGIVIGRAVVTDRDLTPLEKSEHPEWDFHRDYELVAQPARIAELERELSKYRRPAINPPCPVCPSSTPDQVIFSPVYGGNRHFYCKSCEQSFAGAFTYGPSELERRVEELTKVLTRANPPPERAYECLTLLDSAGLGKPGAPHGNTLTGMTHEAVELIATLRAQLAEREEDRALLDWLEANWEFVFQRVSSPGWFYFDQTQQLRMPAKSLRAAIRAARAQPEDGK